jgi:sulfate/thiosulfate transport system ATP-binding protein
MAIDVRNVSKSFNGFKALEDVSLSVPDGSLTALLGPSGGGKSTLLRVIAGLEAPDAGEVLFSGEAVTNLPAQDRGVGFVFQHYAAFKHMTVRDNIAFGLRIRKRPREEIRDRVDELLALVHLGGWANRYPSQLSGGQRQRMALARALAVAPKVLLLDEPFGALDATVRKELRDWLRKLHDDVGVTTIFVTHDQEEALEVAQQVAVINAGRIEQTGTPDDLYERPVNPFVMSFVGPVSKLGDAWVRPHDIELLEDEQDGAVQALVERVAKVGFEVRIEAALGDGTPVPILATRQEAYELELRPGQIVWMRVQRAREFAAAAPRPVASIERLQAERQL